MLSLVNSDPAHETDTCDWPRIKRRRGNLTVVDIERRPGAHGSVSVCVCDCGTRFRLLSRYVHKHFVDGLPLSCGCDQFIEGDQRQAFAEWLWRSIADQAVRRGIPFLLSPEDGLELFKEQRGCCALTGVALRFFESETNLRRGRTASLDRINSDHGYMRGNVQWVHARINMMKGTMSNDSFIDWCSQVRQHAWVPR